MTDQTTETRVAEIEKRAEKAANPEGSHTKSAVNVVNARLMRMSASEAERKENRATCQAFLADARFQDSARDDVTWLIAQLRAAWKREAALREALEWYGENARLCRLIHSGGDEGRKALSDDGGNRARTALQETADGR